MSATATPLVGTTGFPEVDVDSAQLYPFQWMVTGLSVGEDPLQVSGIPSIGHSFTIGDYKYTLDRLSCSPHSDNACTVTGYYSTDARFRFPRPELRRDTDGFRDWDLGFKIQQIEMPAFVRGMKQQRDAMGNLVDTVYWFEDAKTLDVEFDVLNVQVTLEGIDPASIADIIEDVRARRGKIHRFFGNDWLMRMPFIRQSKEQTLTISYAWEFDPGSFAPGPPGNLTSVDYVSPPDRPSWHVWQVLPVRTVDQRPDIVTIDLFPPGSSARDDEMGWRNLPGRPL